MTASRGLRHRLFSFFLRDFFVCAVRENKKPCTIFMFGLSARHSRGHSYSSSEYPRGSRGPSHSSSEYPWDMRGLSHFSLSTLGTCEAPVSSAPKYPGDRRGPSQFSSKVPLGPTRTSSCQILVPLGLGTPKSLGVASQLTGSRGLGPVLHTWYTRYLTRVPEVGVCFAFPSCEVSAGTLS